MISMVAVLLVLVSTLIGASGAVLLKKGSDRISMTNLYLISGLFLYALSTVFGLIAISYSRLNIFIISIIAFLGLTILLFFGFFLFEVTSYNNQPKLNQKIKNENLTNFKARSSHKSRYEIWRN